VCSSDLAPMEGSPAAKAGLQPNDIIIAIDQVPTKGMDLTGSAAKLRGKPGTKISLGIRRQQRTFTVTLSRAILPINPVRTAIKQVKGIKLGYIRLASFNGNAVTELKQAIASLEKAQVKGYILDLRHNPGGLFAAGVEAAKLWLPPNQTIVSTVTRKGARDVALSAAAGPMTNKPLALLVDSGTASSSEILSGALQDNGRAKLVGTKTFGKGLIQQVYTLSDGSGLAVSIAKYQTPSGRDIHKIGIQPDLKVELPPTFSPQNLATAQDPQFVAAERLLTGA